MLGSGMNKSCPQLARAAPSFHDSEGVDPEHLERVIHPVNMFLCYFEQLSTLKYYIYRTKRQPCTVFYDLLHREFESIKWVTNCNCYEREGPKHSSHLYTNTIFIDVCSLLCDFMSTVENTAYLFSEGSTTLSS